MAYRGTSTIMAQVAVSCERCGNGFGYNHKLASFAQHSNEYRAMAIAQENLQKRIDAVKAGNVGLIAENKRCPKCGYVQSWMIAPIRKRRGMIWGLVFGIATYVVAFPMLFVLNNSPLHSDYMIPVFFFVLPVAIYFIVRSIVMLLYRPNRGSEVQPQAKLPNIEFKSPLDLDNSGEWKCPNCGGTNPAKRKTCLGCNTPNPA